MKILTQIRQFIGNDRGVTSIEYGILAAGIAVAIGALVSGDGAFTKAITEIFNNIISEMPKSGGAAK